MNRCTYDDEPKCKQTEGSAKKGYLYQLIYSCRTCYNELIVDKIGEMAKKAKEPEMKLPMKEIV